MLTQNKYSALALGTGSTQSGTAPVTETKEGKDDKKTDEEMDDADELNDTIVEKLLEHDETLDKTDDGENSVSQDLFENVNKGIPQADRKVCSVSPSKQKKANADSRIGRTLDLSRGAGPVGHSKSGYLTRARSLTPGSKRKLSDFISPPATKT